MKVGKAGTIVARATSVGRSTRNPLAFARSRPSPVRVRISSRSNSAKPPNTVSINRPCAVVVSAQASLSDLKPAPFAPIVPSKFRRSRVDRANRSSRVTNQYVTLREKRHQLGQLLTIRTSSADLLLKYL